MNNLMNDRVEPKMPPCKPPKSESVHQELSALAECLNALSKDIYTVHISPTNCFDVFNEARTDIAKRISQLTKQDK